MACVSYFQCVLKFPNNLLRLNCAKNVFSILLSNLCQNSDDKLGLIEGTDVATDRLGTTCSCFFV